MRRALLVFAVPLAANLLAFAITSGFADVQRAPFFPFFVSAILVCTYVAGWRAGMVSLICAIGINAYILPPTHVMWIGSRDNAVRVLGFAIVALIGIWIIVRLQVLLQRERLLNAVIRTSPSLIVLSDAQGRILLFNKHCEEVTGYREAEVRGKTICDLFVPEEWKPVVNGRFADLDSPAVREPHQNPWRTKAGNLRDIEWRCAPVAPTVAGLSPLILGVGQDVTERRRAEDTLRQEEKVKAMAELINTIAHELHNPMQALVNLLTLLRSEPGHGDLVRIRVEMADEQLRRMTEVTTRLLATTQRMDGPVSETVN